MPITVNCSCGGRFRVGDQHAGKKIKCPKCAGAVLVPADGGDAEPVAAKKTAAPEARKSSTSKIAKPPERGKGNFGRYAEEHRGDTVNIETANIEVVSMKNISDRVADKKKDKEKKGLTSRTVADPGEEKKKLVVMSVVVVGLLLGAIFVTIKVLHDPNAGHVAPMAAPPPVASTGPNPANPTFVPQPVTNPTPTPNPKDPTPSVPQTGMPTEPESLDGLEWPITELGIAPPESVRREATIPAKGKMPADGNGKQREYDISFHWIDGAVVGIDGWFEDIEGNRLVFAGFQFLTTRDKALVDAAAEKGVYQPRYGAPKSGSLDIQFAGGKGTLSLVFADGRLSSAKGVARSFSGDFADIEKLRAEHQAVSTLSGVLQIVSTEIRNLALTTASR